MKSNDGLKQTDIKNNTCYYFDDIININDLDLENILIDKNSYEDILICCIQICVCSLCAFFSIKQMDILENMIELNVYHYFILMKSITNFLIELDI